MAPRLDEGTRRQRAEAFMVRMVIEGISSILSQCEIIDENWNDGIELTPEVIGAIKEQIKDKEVRF